MTVPTTGTATGFSTTWLREELAAIEAARVEQLTGLDAAPPGPVTDACRVSVLRILDEVRVARRRLDDGRYGDCQDCGGEIGAELLDLRLWSVRCEACEQERP